jgi:tetratricopeptide (TPR) repeat protein
MPYHLLGEHEKELAAADAAHQADPDILWFLVCQARANVGLGRLPQMEQVLEAMLSFPTNRWGFTQEFVFSQVARDLEAHGYSAQARDLNERALAWYRSRPQEEQDNEEGDYAVVLYGAGHWAEARTVVQHIIATADPSDQGDPVVWYRGAQSLLGGIAAHLGDQREMHRVDRWLASRKGPYLTGVPTFDRARMAAIRGDRERAVTLIRLAMDQGYPLFLVDLGLHNDPDFKTLWGYPPFEELRRPKESSGGN